jgi:hypothetical protein
MHICHEEIRMILYAIPFLAPLGFWIRSKFHKNETCPHPEPVVESETP